MPVNAASMLANFNTQETSGTIKVPVKQVDVVGELGVSFRSVVDKNPVSISRCPGLMNIFVVFLSPPEPVRGNILK